MNNGAIFKLTDNWNLHKEELKDKGNKYYLFNVKDGDIIRLNEVSFDILSYIDGEKSFGEIFNLMKDMYNVDENILRKDMTELIEKCLDKKIIAKI